MSAARKRKVHTLEFKANADLEALRGVKTINGIGQEHGVHPGQVGQLKREIHEQAQTLFERKRGLVRRWSACAIASKMRRLAWPSMTFEERA